MTNEELLALISIAGLAAMYYQSIVTAKKVRKMQHRINRLQSESKNHTCFLSAVIAAVENSGVDGFTAERVCQRAEALCREVRAEENR